MTTDHLPALAAPEPIRRRIYVERRLLGIGGAFVLLSMLALSVSRAEFRPFDWLSVLIWVACAVIGHLLLEQHLPGRDPVLFPLTMFLSGWGLVMIDRLAPNFADRQTLWLIVGTVGLLGAALIPQLIRWLRVYRYTLLIVGLGLLVSTIILGRNPSGQPGAPELWLGFGAVNFQPSEPLKVILVAFLASYLGEQYPALRAGDLAHEQRLPVSPRILGPVLLMWGLSVVILVWQKDLGTAILFFVIFLILLYVASGYTLILVGGAALIGVAGVVAYSAFAVVRLRVDIWVNPWNDANGRAFQIVQSLLAFAAGGIFGQGIGQGSPNYIPVVHSDFVLAAVGEEWGLLGVIVVIVCFGTLLVRGLRISVAQRGRPFNTLLAVGLSALLAVQSLFIMSGVLKLAPLTGVTLPFMSYGGSSLVVNFIIIGLLLRLSTADAS